MSEIVNVYKVKVTKCITFHSFMEEIPKEVPVIFIQSDAVRYGD
jgi:hypothetical protein